MSRNEWSKKILEIERDDEVLLSVVFTWDLPAAHMKAVWHKSMGKRVRAGGPAVALMPSFLAGVAEIGNDFFGALQLHNPNATRTSIGCVRRCPFCAVPQTEGTLIELDIWPRLPIICDNNLLACSRAHFDKAIDKLKGLKGVDFNQGLDARLLTKYYAGRLAELDCRVRLAFDHNAQEGALLRAVTQLKQAGFPNKQIGVYVLIGFDDTPDDALGRLEVVADLGLDPFPMRYNPLDALMRDSYVAPGWTDWELKKMVRYWANLRFFRAIPYDVFDEAR